MSTARTGVAGSTRTCPHCRAVILESSSVCPSCRHHLRFDPSAAKGTTRTETALSVEGTIRHPPGAPPWEYAVVVAIRNARGEEVARQVVGVGALQPSDERVFSLSVEVFVPQESVSRSEDG
ncbi:MAG: hypothetical protein KJZ47_05490 [Gemmatimonadales bacterium]|nr:hypothetical protein [Gemmatimonadales bacterium]